MIEAAKSPPRLTLSTLEVAQALGVSEGLIIGLADSGKIPCYRLHRIRRFPLRELAKLYPAVFGAEGAPHE